MINSLQQSLLLILSLFLSFSVSHEFPLISHLLLHCYLYLPSLYLPLYLWVCMHASRSVFTYFPLLSFSLPLSIFSISQSFLSFLIIPFLLLTVALKSSCCSCTVCAFALSSPFRIKQQLPFLKKREKY